MAIVHIACEMKVDDKPYYDWADDSVYSDKDSIDFEILRSMSLIERISTDFLELEHAALTVSLYHVTELGFDFWNACGSGVR